MGRSFNRDSRGRFLGGTHADAIDPEETRDSTERYLADLRRKTEEAGKGYGKGLADSLRETVGLGGAGGGGGLLGSLGGLASAAAGGASQGFVSGLNATPTTAPLSAARARGLDSVAGGAAQGLLSKIPIVGDALAADVGFQEAQRQELTFGPLDAANQRVGSIAQNFARMGVPLDPADLEFATSAVVEQERRALDAQRQVSSVVYSAGMVRGAQTWAKQRW